MDNQNYTPFIGIELEFYIEAPNPVPLLALINEECKKQNLYLEKIDEEEGEGQFEVSFYATRDINNLANQVENFKQIALDVSAKHNQKISFKAKPFKDRPGSAMHINISLLDKFGNNAFAEFSKDGDSENELLKSCINVLLDDLLVSMHIFAPFEECYDRFNINLSEDRKTPTTVSWGGNNRTVALRLPETTMRPHKKRIEHRVPCADADPKKVLEIILKSITKALREKGDLKYPKIWGVASDEQYNLTKLPLSLNEAKNLS